MKEKDLWKRLAKYSDLSAYEWEQLSPTNLLTSDGYDLSLEMHTQIAQRIVEIETLIRKAKKAKKDTKKYSYLADAFRKAILIDGHSYNPLIIKVLRSFISAENDFYQSMVSMPETEEMKYPTRKPLYNHEGVSPYVSIAPFDFDLEDAEDIWALFN